MADPPGAPDSSPTPPPSRSSPRPSSPRAARGDASGVDPRRIRVEPGSPPERDRTPDGAPATTPPSVRPPRPPGSSRRRRLLRTLLVIALVLLVGLVGSIGYAWHVYGKLDRVDVHGTLSAASGKGTNYLIVGTDSREGLPADVGNKDVIEGGGVAGERSDTVVVLRISPAGNTMLPIPRDLWLPIAETTGKNRINTAIQGGPARLIKTIQQSLGIPIHHYVQVDFAGFLDLVNAVGGVTIDFDAPAYDDKSGLDIKTTGPVKLDRDQALAYVRSRTYTRIVNGKPVVDGRADLGRIERQQTFLRAVMHSVGEARNPFTLARIANSVASNLKVDDSIGFRDSISLARKLAGLNPETVDLPVTPTRTSGGLDVLLLKQPSAQQALARFS
jgi:LCP family protein required for cell wall assembly